MVSFNQFVRGGISFLPALGVSLLPAFVSVETASGSVNSPLAALFDCDHLVVKSDCLKAYATQINKDNDGGISVGGLRVTNRNKHCPKFTSVCIDLYQESNGLPGCQNSAQEVSEYFAGIGEDPPDPPPAPDTVTGQYCADLSEPSEEVLIGSFSSRGSSGENATHWELRTERDNEKSDRVSGTF